MSKVDARGGSTNVGAREEVEREREVTIEKGPSLMESLKAKGVGGAGGFVGSLPPPKGQNKDEDYRKFEEDMKEFL